MKDLEILEEVLRRSKDYFWCQEGLEQLDLYIGACEAWCDAHIFVAYQLGREDLFHIL